MQRAQVISDLTENFDRTEKTKKTHAIIDRIVPQLPHPLRYGVRCNVEKLRQEQILHFLTPFYV